ncbi:multicopper oxidase family protein [Actinoplanes aureus]|uniref:Multicopper oxidase family protein n=1 Tax=Actinoplanes aureus TaxID=2792083 RepID=A0A931C950_9ACTN|nr:multicopper oxidase family protein [Actinoplanes aureus]MBG0563657.1 multicopper oxidase family protein [Actinoplanes aureus]
MFEAWTGVDISASFALIVFWALTSWQLGRVVRQTEPGKLTRNALWALVLLVVAGIPALVKAALVGILLAQGWLFGVNHLVFVVPMVVIPAVLSFWWTFPALLALRRAADGSGAERRAALTDLRPALPPRLTAIGGAFAVWLAFFRQPVPSLLDEIALYGTVFLLAALTQVVKLRRVAGRVAAGGEFPRWGIRAARAAATVVAFVAVVVLGLVWAASASKVPGRYNMAEHVGGTHAQAAAAAHSGGAHAAAAPGKGTSITELTGPRDGEPDRKFTLTAQTSEITLPSGARIQGWTYNGTAPGPQLRVRQNELVEVELINKDVTAGVSLHWHGVDVPNAEDGVPGLTQHAVPVGGRHVYRFRPPDVGSYWYHSHQISSEQVRGGLFGAIVVDAPAGADAGITDIPVVVHTFKGQHQTVNGVDQVQRRATPAGTKVRLRLINSDSQTRRFGLTGTPFRVTGIDGTPVNGPAEISDRLLVVGGGARYDLEFTMPAGAVRLATTLHPDKGLLLSPDGAGELAAKLDGEPLDANSYGTPAPTEFGPGTRPEQMVEWIFDNRLGFFDGSLRMVYTANGDLFPDVPPVTVREGDIVKMRFVNRSFVDHPMHLHGHHVLVLSRNGMAASGSPQWLDTVTVHPGETYEIMFKADNPGIWMDHCHDLDHAAVGMVMHLNYEGYSTPFEAGHDTPNQPE